MSSAAANTTTTTTTSTYAESVASCPAPSHSRSPAAAAALRPAPVKRQLDFSGGGGGGGGELDDDEDDDFLFRAAEETERSHYAAKRRAFAPPPQAPAFLERQCICGRGACDVEERESRRWAYVCPATPKCRYSVWCGEADLCPNPQPAFMNHPKPNNNNNNNKAFKSQTSWGRLELKPSRSNQGSGT